MSNCTVKVKVLNDLKEKKVIKAGSREILDLATFERLNDKYTKLAIEKYDLETYGKSLFEAIPRTIKTGGSNRLRSGERVIYKAEPNNELFDILDDVITEYQKNNSYESKIPQKFIADLEDSSVEDRLFTVKKQDDILEENEDSKVNEVLFDNKEKDFTANEILDNIVNNKDNFTSSTQQVINKLSDLLKTSNSKIKFVSANSLANEDTLMEYEANSNTIRISKDKLDLVDVDTAALGFLHEVVHSVTVNSYEKANTINEKIFRDFIDDIFNEYKAKTDSQSYGFTNQAEFISEIMTNTEFQNEIKNLSEKNKSIWARFIDHIRSLLGLKANSDYNAIIESISNVIKDSNYKGNDLSSDIIYEAKVKEVKEEKGYYKLETIDDKLNYTLNKVKDNLEQNIANYDYIIKKIKDPSKLEKYNDKLKELLEDIDNLDRTKQWKGISMYAKQLSSNMNSLEKRFASEDMSDENILESISLYNKYLKSNALVDSVQSLISDAKTETNLPLTEEEISEIQGLISEASSKYSKLSKDFFAYHKKALKQLLNHRKYASEVLYKWRDDLGKKFDQRGLTGSKESWISRQMNTTYAEQIDEEVEQYINGLIDNHEFDISQAAYLSTSAINTNSKLVQVLQIKLNQVRENIIERSRTIDLELQSLFEEFIDEKGNKKPKDLYKNLIEYLPDGTPILKSEYKLEFKQTYEKLLNEYNGFKEEIEGEKITDPASYKRKLQDHKFRQWTKDNTKSVELEDGSKVLRPTDKWKTDLSKLSKVELKVLNKAKEIFNTSNKQTYGMQSLISKPLLGARYYRLPSVNKSDLERMLEGDIKGVYSDKVKNLQQIRTDDVGYAEKNIDIQGNPVYRVRVHFRGNISPKDQSLDLLTLVRMEAKNGISFEEKSKAEVETSTLLDIAEHKEYYRTQGTRIPIIGRHIGRNKKLVMSGIETNTYKRLQGMIESNIYDILHKDMGKLGSIDANKAIGTLNAWTGLIGMSLNEISAVTNVLNGKAQMFLETVAGNYITRKSLAKAEKLYFSDIQNNLKDVNKPVATSFSNQLNEMFDTFGSVTASVKQGFIENGIMKSNLNLKSLQFMQDTGEHWLQSTLTMAVLDNIKVLDGNSKFINKNGKVVKDKKSAASVLDMLTMKDGKLTMNEKVTYTTHTMGVDYKKGGKEMLNNLVKKKVFDAFGNYDPNMQPEVMRHGAGKLLLMYRKFLIPMGIARFRGMAYANKKVGNLEYHQKFFSEALQEYETGTYTEVVRYTMTSVIPALKKLQFSLLKEDWQSLTTFQKKQIHKAIVETAITAALLPAMLMLLEGLKDAGDDDDGWLYFTMLQTRRLKSELASFRNINEQWRILKSPIPAMRVAEAAGNLIITTLSPWTWDDTYESGPKKGDLKALRNIQELIPILNNLDSTYQNKLQYIEHMAN